MMGHDSSCRTHFGDAARTEISTIERKLAVNPRMHAVQLDVTDANGVAGFIEALGLGPCHLVAIPMAPRPRCSWLPPSRS
jgi:hypothetical protein